MPRNLTVATALLLLLVVNVVQGQEPALRGKKLLEFGWDEPDTAFLRAHIGEMQRTPFNGCVWIYSETPRWWSAEYQPLKVPAAYDSALRSCFQERRR